MDEQSKKHLEDILRKDIPSLTEADKIFLRARRTYLTRDQMGKYIDILSDGLKFSETIPVPQETGVYGLPSKIIEDAKRQKMLDNLAKARAARKNKA